MTGLFYFIPVSRARIVLFQAHFPPRHFIAKKCYGAKVRRLLAPLVIAAPRPNQEISRVYALFFAYTHFFSRVRRMALVLRLHMANKKAGLCKRE